MSSSIWNSQSLLNRLTQLTLNANEFSECLLIPTSPLLPSFAMIRVIIVPMKSIFATAIATEPHPNSNSIIHPQYFLKIITASVEKGVKNSFLVVPGKWSFRLRVRLLGQEDEQGDHVDQGPWTHPEKQSTEQLSTFELYFYSFGVFKKASIIFLYFLTWFGILKSVFSRQNDMSTLFPPL